MTHVHTSSSQRGFGLVIVLMIVGLLAAISAAVATRIRTDTKGQAASHTAPRNVAAAEAGVNQAAAQFRNTFISGNVPAGNSSSQTGDYALQSTTLGSYPIGFQLSVPATVTNPTRVQLPLGVPYGGLNSIQYRYSVVSGSPDLTNPSAKVRSEFQVNNIPTFQFAAFYTGRLEIEPGANMDLHGRVHSNSDIYLSAYAGNTLTIADAQPNIPTVQISSSRDLYRGRYHSGVCDGTVTIDKLSCTSCPNLDPLTMDCGGSATRKVPDTEIANWLGSIRVNVPNIGIPAGYSTARPTGEYFKNADLRIVLDLTPANDYTRARGATNVPLHQIIVQDQNGTKDDAATTLLRSFMHARPGSIFYTDVPVTANNGATLCTDQSTAAANSTQSGTTPTCTAAGVADYRRYSPPFQLGTGSNTANAFVYREADRNGSTDNHDLNWTLSSDATRDQLGNNDATALGDYRRGGFYNNRENKWMYLLNVNVQDLLTWDRAQPTGSQLFPPNNTSNGGTVLYLSVIGPIASGINNYGVRVFDSPNLGYAINIANPTGITVVSDQPMYVEGTYNQDFTPTGTGPTGIVWRHAPAALIGDSMNVLSQGWETTSNSQSNDQKSAVALSDSARNAVNTTINSAFLSGVDGSIVSATGYNGGLENFIRFHESWSGRTLTYRGSFVSLSTPSHVNGVWCGTGNTCNIYNAPARQWDYDAQFNDVEMLPPMTPTFVSIQQLVISEDFR